MTEDPYKKPVSYTAGFFMLIAFGIAGMIFGTLLGGILWTVMTGKSMADITTAMGNPAYLKEMQVLQTFTTVFGFLVPAIATAAFLSRKPLKLIGFEQKPGARQLVLTVGIILTGLGVSSALGYLTYQLPLPQQVKIFFDRWENMYASQVTGLISLKNPSELVVSVLILALVPAICEETFFRGGLQNFMYRSNRNLWLSVIVVSLIFSAVHMSGYGFLSRFALGIILGLIYQLTGSIWLNILAHFINNALAVIMMYTEVQAGKSVADAMNDKSGSYWGLAAIPVVVLLFLLLFRKTKQTELADGV
ncbi:Abortive infection protein [Niabella ginsenosidivorans]|uniref:Abortive infection protein n=2 Tax=Niabella ginsenosidivorans TaxID=1176587 RepID=A0A1A9IBH7_9BACT|nr:Abortive infection protein [Niabella ginsenosidivorans]